MMSTLLFLMVGLQGGLQTLPHTMAAKLDVRYQVDVQQVHSQDDGVTIDFLANNGQLDHLQVDKCLITAPFDQAQAMYPRFGEISDDYQQHITYMTMPDIKLAYDASRASKATMVMIPFQEDPTINVISLSHNKAADRAPAGKSLFPIFTEHRDYAHMAAKTDEEIVVIMREKIEGLYLEAKGRFLFSYVARQTRVSYVPDAGFFHRTRTLWDAIGKEPRVQLGGDIFMFGGLEAAVASGERAAARLL